ncbi:MAG: hypothetical protein KAI40_03400 [Desulfobacterales bacterium]|nr:hypothetical protein [Desulfobacterales bacterium]
MLIQKATKGTGVTIKGIGNVIKGIKKAGRDVDKALNTAVKVEGFVLKRILQKEIRAGKPGGKAFTPLSFIARRLHGRRPNRKPLEKLASVVRYQVTQNPFSVMVGWVGKNQRTWRKLAKAQQEGFKRAISPGQRRLMTYQGASLGKVEGGSTPFFLRKTTQFFTTPAREIMSPFWQAHERSANRNISNNFKKKLKGIRI